MKTATKGARRGGGSTSGIGRRESRCEKNSREGEECTRSWAESQITKASRNPRFTDRKGWKNTKRDPENLKKRKIHGKYLVAFTRRAQVQSKRRNRGAELAREDAGASNTQSGLTTLQSYCYAWEKGKRYKPIEDAGKGKLRTAKMDELVSIRSQDEAGSKKLGMSSDQCRVERRKQTKFTVV